MKNLLSFLLPVAILLNGCTQEELRNSQPDFQDGRTFTASFEQDRTRTYVEDGNLLRWTAGDQISLFDGNTLNRQYKFDGETGDNSGTFSIVSKPFGTGNALNANYSVYPYSSDVKITETGVITATLPAEQSYAYDSFGLGANTMVAVTKDIDDTFLKFKNVCGYLKIRLYGDDITVKSISLTGNDNEGLAGKASVATAYGDEPKVVMSDEATSSITLNCGEGVKIGSTAETATAFWIAVPPTTFERGFEITVTDINGNTFTKSTSNEITVERNVIKPMKAFEVEMETIHNSQILYTYSGDDGINPYRNQAFLDANGKMLKYTNEYADGKGVITFNGVLTTLGEWAFYHSDLTSITLPEGLTKIEKEAFMYCGGLETVTLPNTLTTIEMGAFHQHSSLSKFYGKFAAEDGRCIIVDGVLNAFASACGVTEYTIPNIVTTIGDYAFFYCESLTSITIPNNVTTIGDYAFYRCSSLVDVTIPDSVTTIGDWAFSSCLNLTSVTLSDSVTTIEDYAFSSCEQLVNITMGNSVMSIGERAFSNCTSLISIVIPDSVTTIDEEAFSGCVNIEEFKGKSAADNGCSLIVDNTLIAFAPACNATEYNIPNGVTRIGNYAFDDCDNLISITIPGSVSSIGEYVFYGCGNLAEVYCEATTPPSLDSNSTIFSYSWNGKIYVYKECVEIYKLAWYNNRKQIYENGDYPYNASTVIYYTTSDGQTITCDKIPIKSNTYSNGQGKMVIYGGLRFIPYQAFRHCSNLTSMTIPGSVTRIESNAFEDCESLASITVPNSVTTIEQRAFYNCTQLTDIVLGNGIITIEDQALASCSNLASITIPDSVISIGSGAFNNCQALESVTIGEGVTSIGTAAFLGCINLAEFKGKFASADGRSLIINNTIAYYANASGTEFTIPDGVTMIGDQAFAICLNLTSVTIPESVIEIIPSAFFICPNLKEFKGKFAADGGRCLVMDDTIITYAEASGNSYRIPDNITAIGDYAFYIDDSLTSVTFGKNVTDIHSSAFSQTSLSSVTLGGKISRIYSYAFNYCPNLSNVIIGENVTEIYDAAFYNCQSLKKVEVKAIIPPKIQYNTFDRRNDLEFYIPAGSLDAYLAAEYWRDFNLILE